VTRRLDRASSCCSVSVLWGHGERDSDNMRVPAGPLLDQPCRVLSRAASAAAPSSACAASLISRPQLSHMAADCLGQWVAASYACLSCPGRGRPSSFLFIAIDRPPRDPTCYRPRWRRSLRIPLEYGGGTAQSSQCSVLRVIRAVLPTERKIDRRHGDQTEEYTCSR